MARPPPLNALRVFEAAARHLSFTRAADELHVTQGAVSQQIRGLEAAVGVALFERMNRALRLTPAGERYAEAVRRALQLVTDATEELRGAGSGDGLDLTCLPSFAHKWLTPRLGRFTARHPDIPLRLHTSFAVVDLVRDGMDCAIRVGTGPYPGLYAEVLLTEELAVMCSPGVAARLAAPRDLAGETLIRDFGTPWQEWLDAAGLAERAIRWGPEFLDSAMALAAAIDGQGVVLGHTALAHDDLAAGRLVSPFDLRVPYDFAHWMVCKAGAETSPRIAALFAWLREEAASFPRPTVRLGRVGVPRLRAP